MSSIISSVSPAANDDKWQIRAGHDGLDVQRTPIAKLAALDGDEPSRAMRARVEAARTRQAARFAPLGKPNLLVNGDMGRRKYGPFAAWTSRDVR
jgi:hypothetical protein